MPKHSRRNEQLAFEQKKKSVLITPPRNWKTLNATTTTQWEQLFFFSVKN